MKGMYTHIKFMGADVYVYICKYEYECGVQVWGIYYIIYIIYRT